MIDLNISIIRDAYRLDAAFKLPSIGITGLVGPSGCGKTSLHRVIAGLDTPSEGLLKCRDEIWFDGASCLVPVNQRRVGVVFQDMRLFPHLSVGENLALAAKWGGASPLSDQLISALELSDLVERSPQSLSGGEGRRVALARALAQSPQVLLLDEPLTGLDPAQKDRILPIVANAIDLAGIPALFVSHDPDDVAKLCAQYVEISKVNPTQVTGASPRSFVTKPLQVAGPQIRAVWQGFDQGVAHVSIGGQNIALPKEVLIPNMEKSTPVFLRVGSAPTFIAGEDVVTPKGFIRFPTQSLPDDGLQIDGNPAALREFSLANDAKNQKDGRFLYARPVALFKRHL